MHVTAVDHSAEPPTVAVSLTSDDVVLLNNCINETLEALDDDDLDTRVGGDRARLTALLADVDGAYRALQPEGS